MQLSVIQGAKGEYSAQTMEKKTSSEMYVKQIVTEICYPGIKWCNQKKIE